MPRRGEVRYPVVIGARVTEEDAEKLQAVGAVDGTRRSERAAADH
jgi:hypothetical protein